MLSSDTLLDFYAMIVSVSPVDILNVLQIVEVLNNLIIHHQQNMLHYSEYYVGSFLDIVHLLFSDYLLGITFLLKVMLELT